MRNLLLLAAALSLGLPLAAAFSGPGVGTALPAPTAPETRPNAAGDAESVGGTAYATVLKGKSQTTMDQSFSFLGAGETTIDPVTGQMSFSYLLSNGLTFSGSGQVAVSGKGRVFGLVNTSSGGISGSAILEGKVKKDNSSFSVKIVAAIPNRLGPAPAGFVLAKIAAKGQVATD